VERRNEKWLRVGDNRVRWRSEGMKEGAKMEEVKN
jgi:hypothetical protein